MLSLNRETTWQESSKEEIEKIYQKLKFQEIPQNSIVTINTPIPISCEITTDSYQLLKNLERMLGNTNSTAKEKLKMFFVRDKDIHSLESTGFKLPNVETDCFGLCDSKENTLLITGGQGYGLLKSVVYGFASLSSTKAGYFPAHGAVIQINGKGKLLVGHHGAGKTTTLLHLMHYFSQEGIRLLTDDWALFNDESNSIKATSLEQRISFKRDFIDEFPNLDLNNQYNKNKIKGIPKVYIKPDDIYGEGTFVETSQIDSVVLLDPRNSSELFSIPSKESAIELLVDSSYHMPDVDKNIKEKQYEFWRKVLESCNLISLDTRYSSPDNRNTYNQIFDNLRN